MLIIIKDVLFDNIKNVIYLTKNNSIGDVIISVLALSTLDRAFKPQSCQTKDY